MKCPHCLIFYYDNSTSSDVSHLAKPTNFAVEASLCPDCKKYNLHLVEQESLSNTAGERVPFPLPKTRKLIFPSSVSRSVLAAEVPDLFVADYKEACAVLPISPKASATLSRRVLQAVLHAHGYERKNLSLEIEALLNEADPKKAIPESLRGTIDGIRNFGNFSAHPVTDETTLQIIDVEPEEAEWCLEIVEEMFQHYYVRPAAAKKRKDALNAKLTSAGKPSAK